MRKIQIFLYLAASHEPSPRRHQSLALDPAHCYRKNMAHPPRIPVLLPVEKAVIYFITFCVQDRHKVLANPETMAAFLNAAQRMEGRWIVRSATLMPDHIHVLAIPHDRYESVGNFAGAIKRWMRQSLEAKWKWQTGCFDRLLRSAESADAKWHYIRENPVRAGFVERWQDWPYHIGVDPEERPDLPFVIEA
jgi:putative transposase